MNANTNVNIPRLIAWPTVRMVATDADAIDVSFGGTELIITFVFGGENIPNPIPYIIIDIIRNSNDVVSFKNVNNIRDIVPRVIPMAAKICGMYLSDSLPAIGASITWHNGATSNIIPAVCESNPLMYCRW